MKSFNTVINGIVILILPSLMTGLLSAQPTLSSLPKVSRIWVGTEKALVTSAQFKEFYALGDGKIEMLVKDGQWLKKGQHWATLDPESLQLERETLALEKEKNEQRFIEFEELLDNKLDGFKKALGELRTQDADLLLLAEQKEVTPVIRKKIIAAQKEIKEREKKLLSKISPENIALKSELKKRELDLLIRKKEKMLSQSIRKSELKAPFSGRIDFILKELKKSEGATWVGAGARFATLVDDRRYSLEVTPSGFGNYSGSLDSLEIMLSPDGEGFAITGKFERLEKVQISNRSFEKWVFLVDENYSDQAAKSMGLTRIAHLFKKLDKPAHVVMKKELFSENPELLKKEGWAGLVKYLWPNAQIVFIGPQAIALSPKDS